MKTHTDNKIPSSDRNPTDRETKQLYKQEKLAMALRLNLKRRKESPTHVIDKNA